MNEIAHVIDPNFRDPNHWQGDQSQWIKDTIESERTGRTVSEIQAERRTKVLVTDLHPKELTEIEKQKAKLARDMEQLEAKEESLHSDVARWEKIIAKREKTIKARKGGEYLLSSAQAHADNYRISMLRCLNQESNDAAYNEFPAHIVTMGKEVLAAERVLAMADDWRKDIENRQAEVDAELVAFAKKLGICEKLPEELQKAK